MNLKYILFSILIYSSFSLAGNINYTGGDIFPVDKEMEPAVRFWITIYAKYNTNQYVLHDSRNLAIVYDVIELGDINDPDGPLNKSQKKQLKDRAKYYKDILTGIAAVFPDSSRLDEEQKIVLRKLSAFNSKKEFTDASRHIRVQKGQKNKFRRGLEISGRYMPFLRKIFKDHNLPEELTILPHVESSFNYRAYSSAGAAGMWQFTRGTGKRYLKISYEVDERLDPLLATEAAAKLLGTNYRELEHWPLAITAYNHGLSGMKSAVRKHGTDLNDIINNYHSRYFKFASRNFYTEFIAALHVVQNYPRYFGVIVFESPIDFKEFQLPRYLKYNTLAQYLDMEQEEFINYNPALRPSIFNNSKYIPKGYRVRLPAHISIDSLLSAIPPTEYLAEQKRSKYYRIRPGDTLSDIAGRYNTSTELLLALNNIEDVHFIREGMTLRLPDETFNRIRIINPEYAKPGTINPIMLNKSGPDSTPLLAGLLWQMEIPEDTSGISGMDFERMDSSDLEIEFAENNNTSVGYIRVEPEETLGHYADWLQIRTQQVRNWNNLSFRSAIHLKQKLKLVFDRVSADEFNRLRLEYHRGIEEDFFMNYEITGTMEHTIKNGDNIWELCNYQYNLPYWLIVDYNKEMDFRGLKAGDILIIPTIKTKNI
jgi:peptidoglycan lytic transglycosylase D